MLDKLKALCYTIITKRKKEIKKMITVKVFSENGLTYFVKKNSMISAQLFRLSHLLRRTGYQTKIVEM